MGHFAETFLTFLIKYVINTSKPKFFRHFGIFSACSGFYLPSDRADRNQVELRKPYSVISFRHWNKAG